MKEIISNYVSELDQFLGELIQQQAPTYSQKREIQKAKRLASLRDEVLKKESKVSVLWKNF